MSNIVLNKGLQVALGRLFNTADAFAAVQAMSADDSAVAPTATDTAANSGGAITNFFAQTFDSTPTRSGQVITWVATVAASNANYTWKRIFIHNAASGSVTASSTTPIGATYGLSLTKTSDFAIKTTGTFTMTDASV